MTSIVVGLLVLTVCLIASAFLLHRYEKKNQEYGQLRLECERLYQSAEEARQGAERAKTMEEASLQHLQEINGRISTNLSQLQSIKQSLETHEEAIRDKLRMETDTQMAQYREEQKQALLQAAKEFSEEFSNDNALRLKAAKELASRLEQLKLNEATAIKVAQEKMKENFTEFHQLLLDDADKSDIRHLRSIEGLLHNAEPLNKVIWKNYYEKPYTDLIGRMGLSTTVGTTGIYKITHIETQMTYVGQAVNIADRWRQHIKRGVGAETPTNNKLYPALKKYGPEAFTFEVLEECPREKLDAQEDYWQDFYKAKEFGFSIK